MPTSIEVVRDPEVLDLEGLRLRLAGEVPGAVLDDHTRWREPLVARRPGCGPLAGCR